MEREEIHYPSASGRATVHAVIWTPGREPVGVMQISHGMKEYIGRYERFAQFMTARGFVVCGNDHLGHGGSLIGGELGYFGTGEVKDQLIGDLHQLTTLMRERYPNLPYILLGHSMGSFLARHYLTAYGEDVDAAVISGTSGTNPAVGFGKFLAKLCWMVRGEHFKSAKFDNLTMKGYNSRYPDAKTSSDWISSDPEEVKKYMADPGTQFLFTVSAFYYLFDVLGAVSDPGWAGKIRKDLPIYLFSGDMDPVGQYGEGVREVASRLRGAGVQDVTLKLYPDGRHEMLNEINRDTVCEELYAWLDEKVLRDRS